MFHRYTSFTTISIVPLHSELVAPLLSPIGKLPNSSFQHKFCFIQCIRATVHDCQSCIACLLELTAVTVKLHEGELCCNCRLGQEMAYNNVRYLQMVSCVACVSHFRFPYASHAVSRLGCHGIAALRFHISQAKRS